MDNDEGAPRIYGAPDADKQPPPASEGLRGEGTPSLEKPKDDQKRSIVAEGRSIEIVETSGAAFAESTNAAVNDD